MTKEEWIKIYTAKDGTWDKDDLIDKAYEIMTRPIRTNYDRIKQMSIDEMTTMSEKFCFNCTCCLASDFCNESFKNETCRDIVKKWLESEVEE